MVYIKKTIKNNILSTYWRRYYKIRFHIVGLCVSSHEARCKWLAVPSPQPNGRDTHARTHGTRTRRARGDSGLGSPSSLPSDPTPFLHSLPSPAREPVSVNPAPGSISPKEAALHDLLPDPSIHPSEVGPWGCRCGGKWGRGSAATPASPRRLTTSGCCWAPPGARRARPRATRYGSCLSAAAASVIPATVLYDRFPRHHYRRWRRSRCDWATSSARNPVIIISSYFIAGYKFGRCKQILGCSRMQPARTAP